MNIDLKKLICKMSNIIKKHELQYIDSEVDKILEEAEYITKEDIFDFNNMLEAIRQDNVHQLS